MSRIGKVPIIYNKETKLSVLEKSPIGTTFRVTGKLGTLDVFVKEQVSYELNEAENKLSFSVKNSRDNNFLGLYRTLVSNAIDGVNALYTKELTIVGIGYRAEVNGDKLTMSIGYSHKINYEIPAGIKITVKDQTNIKIEGIDKQLVGEVAAKVRSFRKPEPYKGKGIRYSNEVVKKKSTKSAK